MRDSNDLDTYQPSGTIIGDYRITEPVNAWDGASNDVTIFHRFVGGLDYQFQLGFDSTGDPTRAPDLFARIRHGGEPWGEWAAAGSKPPEPSAGPTPVSGAINAAKDQITLTFSGPLKAGAVGVGNFNVQAGASAASVTAATAAGSAVNLTLAAAAVAGDTITVGYVIAGTPYLLGSDNAPVAPFSGVSVPNPAA